MQNPRPARPKIACNVHTAVLSLPFAGRLVYDVLVVVVAQAAGELLVVHLGLVLPHPPPPRHLQVK